MTIKLIWEQVTNDGTTWRLRVLGGWLVRYSDDVAREFQDRGIQTGWDWRSCMVFVPDQHKLWQITLGEQS